jgi:hypothetical protein
MTATDIDRISIIIYLVLGTAYSSCKDLVLYIRENWHNRSLISKSQELWVVNN